MPEFRYFGDFAVGEEIDLGSYPVLAREIIEFAEEYDPAPYHLSEEGGRASMLGQLSASGWHTCAMMMSMMCDAFLSNSSGQGTPGIDFCKWLAPVGAGDILTGKAIVRQTRRSASRPSIGFVLLRFEMFGGAGNMVLACEASIMFGLGNPPAPARPT